MEHWYLPSHAKSQLFPVTWYLAPYGRHKCKATQDVKKAIAGEETCPWPAASFVLHGKYKEHYQVWSKRLQTTRASYLSIVDAPCPPGRCLLLVYFGLRILVLEFVDMSSVVHKYVSQHANQMALCLYRMNDTRAVL